MSPPQHTSSPALYTLFLGAVTTLLILFAVWNCNVQAVQTHQIRNYQFSKNLNRKQLQAIQLNDAEHHDSSNVWENLSVHDESFNNLINKHSNGWWHAGNNKVFTGKTLKQIMNRGSHGRRIRKPSNQLVNNSSPSLTATNNQIVKISNYSIPASYSLLTDSRFSSCKQLSYIRDEEQCGCWAFIAAEVVADRFCVASKTRINEILSPQYLISCDSNNGGCTYGYFDIAFQFIEKRGVVAETCFPFVSGEGTYIPPCPSQCIGYSPFNLYKVNNSRVFSSKDIQGMQLSIMNGGSLAASLDIYRDFLQYRGGVYRYMAGNYLFTHSVKIVGWGITSPQQGSIPYWICATNWTTEWGMKGLFWILRGSNECNVEIDVWDTNPILN